MTEFMSKDTKIILYHGASIVLNAIHRDDNLSCAHGRSTSLD